MAQKSKETTVSNLDAERTRRFFRKLADEPFLCIVITDTSQVQIFSKGLEQEHIDRIREVLKEVER